MATWSPQQERCLKEISVWLRSPSAHSIFMLTGDAGTGKQQPVDCTVQTPIGPKAIGSLLPGDTVYGLNGEPIHVVSVHPQGTHQAYRVTLRDGFSTEAGPEHLWRVTTLKGVVKVYTTSDLMRMGIKNGNGNSKFKIPLCCAVQYPHADLPVHPYLLGALIGDGTALGNTPTLCKPDEEVAMRCAAVLPARMTMIRDDSSACTRWRFRDPDACHQNRLNAAFKALALNVNSPARFVPKMYLLASVQQRLDLLRGLMDTDGSCRNNRTSFSTMSTRLASDVAELVQSLGGIAIISHSQHGGYSLNVKTQLCPFYLTRKADRWKPSWKNPPSRYITDIEPSRVCEQVCIQVNAPDGMYLSDHYIATHNTTLACQIQHDIEDMGKSVGAYAYTGKAASVLRGKGFHDARTFHSDLYIPAIQSRQRLETYQLSYDMADKELVTCTDEQRRALLHAELNDLREKIKLEHEALHNPLFTLNTESSILDLDFLIADEVSMLGSRLGQDLEDTCKRGGVKMLLMGDPNQLPPVKDTAYYMDRKPDFHLDEIHRQARDNPILHLAHLARKREPIPLGSYGDSCVATRLQAQEALECDQMLVGRNRTREYYNRRLREERGYKDLVEIGEKLICLRNSKEGYFNGSVWFVEDVHGATSDKQRVHLSLRSEDTTIPTRETLVHCKTLRGEEIHFMDAQGAQSMVSAQAVTVHKFQGSEGDHIVLLDESRAAARDDWHKWLYTGITRARDKITLVVN